MSKKRKVLGNYFNLDLTQKLNFESYGYILKNGKRVFRKYNVRKFLLTELEKQELAKSRRLNRLRMITRKQIEINKIIRKIMGNV